jgi:formylglycine-generating enzyme required for sulfatase activity
MGSVDGFGDERPRAVVKVEKPFWIAETEITNGQYAVFDSEHDTGYEGEHGFDHVNPGYILFVLEISVFTGVVIS